VSYPRDLDEIPIHELHEEIRRRAECKDKGICDYCGGRKNMEPVCRFPERHSYAYVPKVREAPK
jgi:hypothetical protein